MVKEKTLFSQALLGVGSAALSAALGGTSQEWHDGKPRQEDCKFKAGKAK